MGLFDLLNPALDALDQGLSVFLASEARLLLWALLGAAITMAVYRFTSNQQRMVENRAAVRKAQQELAGFDGEFAEMVPLIRRSMSLSLTQVRLSLGPALLASLPLLFLLAWISNHFDHGLPPPGARVAVAVEPVGEDLHWQPEEAAIATEAGWSVQWPESGDTVTLRSGADEPLLSLPLPAPSPVVHKRQWWNVLIGNPAGYLSEQAPVGAVHVEVPRLEYLPFGPTWVRGGLALFITALMLFSLAIKLAFRIH